MYRESLVIAMPVQKQGQVHIYSYSLTLQNNTKHVFRSGLYPISFSLVQILFLSVYGIVDAHTGPIACLALNRDATRLATASDKGTLIRIFDTQTCQKLQELRRGVDTVEILSMTFDPLSRYLAVSSNKGTIHVFALQEISSGGVTPAEAKQTEGKTTASATTAAVATAAAAPTQIVAGAPTQIAAPAPAAAAIPIVPGAAAVVAAAAPIAGAAPSPAIDTATTTGIVLKDTNQVTAIAKNNTSYLSFFQSILASTPADALFVLGVFNNVLGIYDFLTAKLFRFPMVICNLPTCDAMPKFGCFWVMIFLLYTSFLCFVCDADAIQLRC